VADNVGERRFVEARSFVAAVAGVEADALRRDASQAMRDRLDVRIGPLASLRSIELRIGEDVGEERIARYALRSASPTAWRYSSSLRQYALWPAPHPQLFGS
jgi:hypothetical protein